ncbi:hypothetical protein D3C77_106030 [compost metagenome]
MQALTAIGEVGIEIEGRSYLLRPSLFSMTRIGSPAEIVEAFALLTGPGPVVLHPFLLPDLVKNWKRDRFGAALNVLYACSDEDVSKLAGSMTGYRRYSPGKMSIDEIVAVARSLIIHGVTGNAKPDPKRPPKKGDYLSEFKAADYVATAMAHLGTSERDAWAMTMTSFSAAMRSKFPPPAETEKPQPTAEVIDATMARLKLINAARSGAKA